MNPLISIIVPIYKVEKYLDRCLESIVNQTYTDIEIILVDDGSPDNCPQKCDAWALKDKRIKVIHKKNSGVSSARNDGIKVALGEWIWFVDSDDYIEKDSVAILSKTIQKNDVDLIAFNHNIDGLYRINSYGDFFDDYYFTYHLGFEPWNKIYKASIVKSMSFDTSERIGEDLLFNASYYLKIINICFISNKLYNYTIRSDSAMSNAGNRLTVQLRLYSKIYELYTDILSERYLVQLLIMHIVSGINQSDKKSINKSEIISVFKNYNFSRKEFRIALNRFLKSEKASVWGQLKIRLMFYFMKKLK